jgi:PKD repeat protein
MSLLADGPAGNCWLPKRYQPTATDHVLTCFLMGRNSELLEVLPDDTARINRVLVDLDAALGGEATASYLEGVVQNWTAEPYVLGSYSYPAPGTRPIVGLTKREVLAQPVGSTLYFAGEATHNTAAATVPGALQSGERAAGEIHTTLGGPPAAGTPTASFSAEITSGVVPLGVSFTDLSSETPTGWSWNFGDTGTSGVQHPNHQYTKPGTYTVSLTATNLRGSHTRVLPNLIVVEVGGPRFLRGDADADGVPGLTDAVLTLDYLFRGGGEPACVKAADADDDGAVNVTDAVYLLNFLFLGHGSPPPPFPDCGIDPTNDDLGCESFAACEG